MRIVFFLLFVAAFLQAEKAGKLSEKYQSATKCKSCHRHIVGDWERSWHARSHYQKDEYFQKSIDYIARKTRQSNKTVMVKCAVCHNPRISVTKTNDTFEAIAALGLDEETEVAKALQDASLQEGINCLVCHNIDKIDANAPKTVRGMNRVHWNKNGIMSGPFGNAKSPYHKTQKRDFFAKDPNKLCFVCHANDHSCIDTKFFFTNMEKEYKGDKKCTECHMSPVVSKYASTYRIGGKIKKRPIRLHKFAGAHTESLWKNALDLHLQGDKNNIWITIKNPQPHNIPSGFGGRELLVEIAYYGGTKLLDTKTISLTSHYKRRRSRVSIPHLALKASKDLSIPAEGSKKIKVPKLQGSTAVKVTIYYRLVNDEIRTLLRLKDPIWEKKYFIVSKTLRF